jgi:uncharacterized protein YdhG (YjbR/CyaY superfamily)
MTWDDLLVRLSAPARRALEAAGIRSLRDLAARSETELLALHGLGPKSLGPIREALASAGEAAPGTPAAVFGESGKTDGAGKDPGAAAVDAFIAGYPPAVRRLLTEIRLVIRENAPGAAEKIAYGIPTFTLNGNLVHFSGYGGHIGFYPGPEGIEAFEPELAGYKRAKGSVQFPLDRPLPRDLIARIVRLRVEQNRGRRSRGSG